jgi:hypothetical protein
LVILKAVLLSLIAGIATGLLGGCLVSVILVLLLWPDLADDLTMWILLLAAGLGAISKPWKKDLY